MIGGHGCLPINPMVCANRAISLLRLLVCRGPEYRNQAQVLPQLRLFYSDWDAAGFMNPKFV
jgi:hypothetical protein